MDSDHNLLFPTKFQTSIQICFQKRKFLADEPLVAPGSAGSRTGFLWVRFIESVTRLTWRISVVSSNSSMAAGARPGDILLFLITRQLGNLLVRTDAADRASPLSDREWIKTRSTKTLRFSNFWTQAEPRPLALRNAITPAVLRAFSAVEPMIRPDPGLSPWAPSDKKLTL